MLHKVGTKRRSKGLRLCKIKTTEIVLFLLMVSGLLLMALSKIWAVLPSETSLLRQCSHYQFLEFVVLLNDYTETKETFNVHMHTFL